MRKAVSKNVPASVNRSSNSKSNDNEGYQLVAVAVDGDKNSQHALKWAADHVVASGNFFALLHVRRRDTSILNTGEEEGSQLDIQTQELLTPFQCFCSRRGINCREVVVDDMDISKAIVDFVVQHGVDKLILGASSRNAFSRTFKQADVPYSVSKTAPDFCSVYVISKGKISSSRPATRPKSHNFSGLANDLDIAGNQFQSSKSETIARGHVDNPRSSDFELLFALSTCQGQVCNNGRPTVHVRSGTKRHPRCLFWRFPNQKPKDRRYLKRSIKEEELVGSMLDVGRKNFSNPYVPKKETIDNAHKVRDVVGGGLVTKKSVVICVVFAIFLGYVLGRL